MRHTNCPPSCRICQRIDYSRMRHSHPDDMTCVEAGYIGHPPYGGPGNPDYDEWKKMKDLIRMKF